MQAAFTNLGLLTSQNYLIVYLATYLIGIVAGNIAAFIGFWLVMNGHFGPGGVFTLIPLLFIADMTGDVIWYSLGHLLRDTRFGAWIARRFMRRRRVERYMNGSGKKWLFLSKFVYATSAPVMFMFGWSRMKFAKFLRNSFLATLVWIPVLSIIASSLISALSFLQFSSVMKQLELLFVFGLTLFLVLEYGIAWVFERMPGQR